MNDSTISSLTTNTLSSLPFSTSSISSSTSPSQSPDTSSSTSFAPTTSSLPSSATTDNGTEVNTTTPKPFQCDDSSLTGVFGLIVQLLLAVIAFSTLIVKRACEPGYRRRPWKIWVFDISKQALGAGLMHIVNLIISSSFKGDTCVWYVTNFILDSTAGLLFIYLGLQLVVFIVNSTRCPGCTRTCLSSCPTGCLPRQWLGSLPSRPFRFGDYGTPPPERVNLASLSGMPTLASGSAGAGLGSPTRLSSLRSHASYRRAQITSDRDRDRELGSENGGPQKTPTEGQHHDSEAWPMPNSGQKYESQGREAPGGASSGANVASDLEIQFKDESADEQCQCSQCCENRCESPCCYLVRSLSIACCRCFRRLSLCGGPQGRAWFIQTVLYLMIVCVEKTLTGLFLLLPFWEDVNNFLMRPIQNPQVKIFLVLFVIPLVVNAIIFWVIDTFLMYKSRSNPGTTGNLGDRVEYSTNGALSHGGGDQTDMHSPQPQLNMLPSSRSPSDVDMRAHLQSSEYASAQLEAGSLTANAILAPSRRARGLASSVPDAPGEGDLGSSPSNDPDRNEFMKHNPFLFMSRANLEPNPNAENVPISGRPSNAVGQETWARNANELQGQQAQQAAGTRGDADTQGEQQFKYVRFL